MSSLLKRDYKLSCTSFLLLFLMYEKINKVKLPNNTIKYIMNQYKILNTSLVKITNVINILIDRIDNKIFITSPTFFVSKLLIIEATIGKPTKT